MQLSKMARIPATAFLMLLATSPVAATNVARSQAASPISKVVKALQDMQAKSKADAEEEEELFSKFKCYCKKTLGQTSKTMEDSSDEIAETENTIEALTALGSELAQKKSLTEADMSKNEAGREEAKTVREKSKTAFEAEEKDLSSSLDQLNQALDTLSAVGGEKASLLAESVAKTFGKAKSTSFLSKAEEEAPSPTGGVAGVLRSTRDTYVTNLAEARKAEAAAVTTYEKLKKTKEEEHDALDALLKQTTQSIADTTEELGAKRTALDEAKKTLADATKLNTDTDKLCKEKTKINEERALLRSQEDAAISKATAVLNSDAAFATFSGTKTNAVESFVQLSAVRRHAVDSRRPEAVSLLRATHSIRLARVAAMLSTGNPFEKVLKEIDNMQKVIGKEAKADKKKFDWCAEERKNNNKAKDEKSDSIVALTTSIDKLTKSIGEMKKTIETKTAELAENQEDQTDSTALRKKENLEYQKNIANLVAAQDILAKGTKILKDYYDSIAFVQVDTSSSEDPPDVKDGKFKGQSEAGATVLGLLADVTKDTAKEEKEAHAAEQEAQASFEDEMKALTDAEKAARDTIQTTSADMAESNQELDGKKEQLASTQNEKKSIEEYLASIKSGCDFMAANFDKREAAREKESKALGDAIDSIKGTPAYKKAEAAAALA
eukprot:TRINITY_DN66393_c0_g1_i1.p1 TRINITY_DN66393_c0_g1~~TRINITY_DN66393_c0_g1_i1.p1  ORF type:complete len:667 (+),score=243.62 TRINITY_DN66393_c0_g1_i1:119-2119(+)